MKILKSLWPKLWLPLLFLMAMWIVEITEQILGVSFASLGVLPRDKDGVAGIFLSPFLHGEWDHIQNNSLPFLVLSSFLFLAFRKVSYRVFFLIYVLTGLSVWLLARGGTYHIGASGLVFGLFGFVLFSGLFRMDIKTIGISLVVAFFYGSMVYGIFPGQPGISWESHLLGMVAGGGLAYYYRKVDKQAQPEFMEEPEERRTFEDFMEKIK